MGHQGSVEKKVKAIERLDERIIRPIAEGLAEAGEDFYIIAIFALLSKSPVASETSFT